MDATNVQSAIVALLDSEAAAGRPVASFVAPASLAWLIKCGLRRTACHTSTGAIEQIRAAFHGSVDFEARGLDNPENPVRFYLSDHVMMYAAGARAELAPVWEAHRAAYNQGVRLGRALGYFAPRERAGSDDTTPQLTLRHHAHFRGIRVALWDEIVEWSASVGALATYITPIRSALSEIGLGYDHEFG